MFRTMSSPPALLCHLSVATCISPQPYLLESTNLFSICTIWFWECYGKHVRLAFITKQVVVLVLCSLLVLSSFSRWGRPTFESFTPPRSPGFVPFGYYKHSCCKHSHAGSFLWDKQLGVAGFYDYCKFTVLRNSQTLFQRDGVISHSHHHL